MAKRKNWTREQLLVAFRLYCRIPFGLFHAANPELIRYADLLDRSPSALAMKLSNIASIDPVFIASGRSGLKGAAVADKNMWQEMEGDWPRFLVESNRVLAGLEAPIDTALSDTADMDFSATDKISQTKVRVGQPFFRQAVLSAYDNRCCITGLHIPKLLVASHIKPWKDDEANRLNPSNGLALSMLHDKAFDLGMMTIDEHMKVVVSDKYTPDGDPYFEEGLGRFSGMKIAMPKKFAPSAELLAYHRECIFERLDA